MDWIDLVSILGYPLVGWLSWKAGNIHGIETTVDVLAAQGLLDLEDDE
jgi:hypothetical protein